MTMELRLDGNKLSYVVIARKVLLNEVGITGRCEVS
jgi:hypothetical protein